MPWPWNSRVIEELEESPIDRAMEQGYPLFMKKDNGKIVEVNRIDWDTYFMSIAEKVAERGTCDRKQVGCVLVKDKRIIATGYNGSMSGSDHCDDVGHLMENNHCVRTIHAEVNAVAQCAKHGVSCEGATCYCNTLPCWNCFKTLVNAGVTKIFFKDSYNAELKDKVFEFSEELDIPVVRI
jgi:dCMP deaminase